MGRGLDGERVLRDCSKAFSNDCARPGSACARAALHNRGLAKGKGTPSANSKHEKGAGAGMALRPAWRRQCLTIPFSRRVFARR